jgi:uncharacterized membrane protein (UPF0127 family)
MRARLAAIVSVGVIVALAACDSDTSSDATTTTATNASTAPTPVADAAATAPDGTEPAGTRAPGVTPEGYASVAAEAVTADGRVCELCLWLADTGELRERGLMEVTDLGGADGMVFRYDEPHSGAFWMKDTLLPLSIAFYDDTGTYLDAFDMEPCTSDPCPVYDTPRDFVDAIEIAQGGLTELGLEPGSLLTISDLPCDP